VSVITDIRDLLKLVVSNQKAGLWLIVIVTFLGVGSYFYFNKPHKPAEETDCTFIKQQNKELLSFILEARKEVERLQVQPTSFMQGEWQFMFASDTSKPKKQPSQMQQQQVRLLYKFDSVLLKVKEDSIKRTKNKSKGV